MEYGSGTSKPTQESATAPVLLNVSREELAQAAKVFRALTDVFERNSHSGNDRQLQRQPTPWQ